MKRFLFFSFSLAFFYSCQNQYNAKDQAQSLNDSTSATGLTSDSVKLVKTAGIRFKVSNVEQSLKAVSLLAQQQGGRIYDQHFSATENDRKELKVSDDSLLIISTISPHADVVVRVPSQNLERFLFDVAALGYYTGNSDLTVSDKSLLYLQNALKEKARAAVLSKPSATKASVAGNQQAVEIRDQAIDQMIAAKSIDADVQYSTVNLTLFQNAMVRKEAIANYVLEGYNLSFGQRLQNALRNGYDGFLNFLLVLAHLWAFILLGLFVFALYKIYRSKQVLRSKTVV